MAVPSAEEQTEAASALKQKLSFDYSAAMDEEGKARLADKLLDIGNQMLAEAGRGKPQEGMAYLAFTQGRDIALELGYPILFVTAVQRLSTQFVVDPLEELPFGFEHMLEENRSSSIYRDIAREALVQASRLAGDEHFATAKRLTELAVKAADKSKRQPFKKEVAAEDSSMGVSVKLFDDYEKAQKTLADQADDEAANLAAGKYLCFVKQDWPAGMAHLAKASDPALADLARKSLTVARPPRERLAAGRRLVEPGGRLRDAATRAYRVVRHRPLHGLDR